MFPSSDESLRSESKVLASDNEIPQQGVIRVQIVDARGVTRWVVENSADEADVVGRLIQRGCSVLAIERSCPKSKTAVRRGKEKFPLLQFCQELLALLQAGLNLNEAIKTLLGKEQRPFAAMQLNGLLIALTQGHSFADALDSLHCELPPIFIATVRASEKTGDLPETLSRYISYQVQLDGIKKKLVSASIYPAMLLIVGCFVTLFLLGYVVPRFSIVYESAGRDLPWMSEMLISFGKTIHANWGAAAVCLVSALLVGVGAARSQSMRARFIRAVFSAPFFRSRIEEFRLARFYRALGMLLTSGIPLSRAVPMVSDLLSEAQSSRLLRAREALNQGHRLSDALQSQGLTSAVAESLIRVGERSGQMAQMLERTASFHDEEFTRWIDWTTKILEPLLMAFMGLIIGLIVVLMYMPIFDLAGSLQ